MRVRATMFALSTQGRLDLDWQSAVLGIHPSIYVIHVLVCYGAHDLMDAFRQSYPVVVDRLKKSPFRLHSTSTLLLFGLKHDIVHDSLPDVLPFGSVALQLEYANLKREQST